MLSSGVETQPVPLGSSMSAVVQELYSELPGSVSKELHGDCEPSGIPDVKPGTSRALNSQNRTLPLEQQRTHVERCGEEKAETLDDGGELGWCGLVDSTAGGSVTSGILDREAETKGMELKVFRDQGNPEEVVRHPSEGTKEDPSQHSTVAEEKISPSQEELLVHSRQELLCADLPEDFRRSKGSTQITMETLLQSPEKVQGMKVNEAKMDTNEGHGHGNVSKDLSTGCSEYPEVDRIMASGEVSNTSPLVSIEPVTVVDSGLTEATCKEKECEELKPCPSSLSLLPGNSAISKVDNGKEPLYRLNLVCEADDNHQHVLSHHDETHSSARGSPVSMKSVVVIELLDKHDKISSCTSSGPDVDSRTTSLEECGQKDNGLMEGSTEKIATSCFDDQSKNLASREKNEDPLWNPKNEKGLQSSVNPAQAEEDVNGHHSDCSGDSVTENTPSNCSIPGSIHRVNSSSLMTSCLTAGTGVKLKENYLKITSDIEGSLITHEDQRETSAHVSHLGRHDEQCHFSSLMQGEEPEHAATGDPTVLREKIYNKDSQSIVTIMPESLMSPANEMSEPRSITVPELESTSDSDKTQQTSNKDIPHGGEQSIDCELSELSSTDAVAVNKGESECVLNQQVSLNSQDHVKLPADSLQNINKATLGTASEDFEESHFCPLEPGADNTAGTQIIPIKTDMKVISPSGRKTGGTSSNTSTLNINPGIPELKKRVTGSGTEDLLHSKKKTATFPQEISATKCRNVQSQNKSGCHCVNKNTSEGLLSACTRVESGTTILEGENPLIKCEDTFQKSDHRSQGTKNSVENCVHEGNETLEGNELDRRDTEDHLQGWIREETTVDMLSNGAPDAVTCTTSHIKHSEQHLEGRGQDSSRDTVFCKDSVSDCVPQGLNQSANIPSPEKLLDQSPNLTSSYCKNVNQAEESQTQRAGEAINCWRKHNRPDRWRNEEKAAKQTQDSEQKEIISESDRDQSYDQKDLVPHLGGNHLPSCGSPKKEGFKRSFESHLHYKDSASSLVDTVSTDCGDEPGEGVLDRKASAVDQDPDFPGASASTVESLVKKKSCEEKVCRSLESCEVELYRHSCALEAEADARCAPNAGTLAPGNVSLNSVHHNQQVNGALQREPAVMGEGLSQESELNKGNALEISSRASVSSSCQEENSVHLRSCFSERMPSYLSARKNSAADVNNALGGATKLRNRFKPKDGEILCEGVKAFTVLPEKKEDPPGGRSSPGEGASVCVKSDRPRVCYSDDRHLPVTLEETEVKSNEIREHQGEPLDHLTCGGESEDGMPREDGSDDTSKISHTHFIGDRMVGFAEKQHNQALDNLLQKEERHKKQKRAHAVLEQCTSLDSLSDEVLKKNPPKEEEHKPTVMKETPLAKLTRGDTTAESQKLKDGKVESGHHPLKKDLELSPGPRLPGAPQKAQDPHSARCDELRGAFGNTSHRKQVLPLKKQPPRTCKRTSYQDLAKVGRKLGKIRNTTLLKSSRESIPTKEPRLLHSSSLPPPAQVASEPIVPGSLTHHIPKQWAAPCHLLRKLTKESALLSKLSVLARKLAPDPKTQKLRYWRCSSELLPVAKSYKRLRYRRFLDGFSSNTMQLDPCLAASRWNKTPGSKPVALYPLEAIKLNLVDLSHKMPSLLLGSEILPMSLDVNSGLDCMAEASVTFPEHCAPEGLALGEAPRCSAQPPKWTFSFFFSHGSSGTATFREDTHLQSWACGQAPSVPLTPLHSSGSTALVQSRAGVSVLGLHTLLALCSPGCYRIWTKKRNFSNHMATMQRLFVTQFKQGLKGLRSPASIADKVFCSLPYSLGRVLSIWSQHGPSACPLEISALHSNHSKWQPSLQTSLVTASRLEPPFSALVPKSCLITETPVGKFLLSASEFQVPVFDELDGVTAVCPRPQSSSSEQKEAEPEKRPKKVSQIRIRKTIPKPDPNLTPMGLPRPKRLKKKEFSLEEIYTNKNYKSPPANRCLETIFEEPKERNGTLISISQQKRKRVLEFQDFTVPRKRRVRGKVKVAGSFTRAQKAALQSRELDALLIQKLMELETFFAKEEEQEQSSGC